MFAYLLSRWLMWPKRHIRTAWQSQIPKHLVFLVGSLQEKMRFSGPTAHPFGSEIALAWQCMELVFGLGVCLVVVGGGEWTDVRGKGEACSSGLKKLSWVGGEEWMG